MKTYDVDVKKFLKSSVIGAAVAHISALLLMMVFALIMSSVDFNDTVTGVVSIVILCLSSFFGGFVAAKKLKYKILYVGLSAGGMYYLSLALFAALSGTASFSKMFFIKLGMVALFSALGGIVSALKDKSVI